MLDALTAEGSRGPVTTVINMCESMRASEAAGSVYTLPKDHSENSYGGGAPGRQN